MTVTSLLLAVLELYSDSVEIDLAHVLAHVASLFVAMRNILSLHDVENAVLITS